jgi:uncharacterized protein (DUF1697 family)
MPAAVALLRGINVGGRHMLPMGVLRQICLAAGLERVETLLQSGNVVFETAEKDLEALAGRLESAIEAKAGFRPAVLVWSAAELARVAAARPFPEFAEPDGSRLAVLFLARNPGKAAFARAAALQTETELVRAGKRELYVYYVAGMGRSKLPASAFERTLGVAATGRNWNTVTKLVGMAARM